MVERPERPREHVLSGHRAGSNMGERRPTGLPNPWLILYNSFSYRSEVYSWCRMKEFETFAQAQGTDTVTQEVSVEGPRNKDTMSQFGDRRLATFVEGLKLC